MPVFYKKLLKLCKSFSCVLMEGTLKKDIPSKVLLNLPLKFNFLFIPTSRVGQALRNHGFIYRR